MLATIAGERIHEQNPPLFSAREAAHRENESRRPDYMQSREISVLADKFKSSGIFTDEASKILAESIIKGTIDFLA